MNKVVYGRKGSQSLSQ